MEIFRNTARLVLPALLCIAAVSCTEKEERIDPVDLRFDARDSYSVSALSAEPISFVVKSSDPWEVYSYHPDWCEITPSSGAPGEKCTVTVKYLDSDSLDERIDTLVIKSDYWIGKWVRVAQAGTAYLDVDRTDFDIARTGETVSVAVSSNQKWSADVTEGKEWIEITEGSEGENDGVITLDIEPNSGEIREGRVAVRDRKGNESITLVISEDGIRLDPEKFEIRTYHNAGRVSLHVASDGKWTVSKDSGSDWYSFENIEFDGNGTLNIDVSANTSGGLRKSTFTIRSVSTEAGTVPVEKQVTLKQAPEQVFTRHTWSKDLLPWRVHDSWPIATYPITVGDDGSLHFTKSGARIILYRNNHISPGDYRFRVKTDSPIAVTNIYFQFYGTDTAPNEIRWHLNASTGKTDASTAPNSDIATYNIPFDSSVANDLMVRMSEDNGYIHFEWWLNDTKFAEISSGPDFMKNATWEGTDHIQIQIGSDWHDNGDATFYWYESAPPIDWNQN